MREFSEQNGSISGHYLLVSHVLRIVPLPVEPSGDETSLADDARLVARLRAKERSAVTTLVERHGAHVRRVLMRILGGHDSEMADVFQDVLLNAWASIDGLTEPRALKSWLTQIAIFTARKAIRRRHRRRWLTFFDSVPEPEVSWAGADLQEAASGVYKIFDRMPVDERIPFALRILEGLGLEATAAACGMSVATVRRRLVRAERRFFKLARQFEALAPWLETK